MSFVLWVESCAQHETSKKINLLALIPKSRWLPRRGSAAKLRGPCHGIQGWKLGEIKQIFHAD